MTTPGRRIPVQDGLDPYHALQQAGDYYGPVMGFSGGVPAVFFLLPTATEPKKSGGVNAIHHVQSPPHTFTENPDGTLTISASIGAGTGSNYYWHGYLENGNWREC